MSKNIVWHETNVTKEKRILLKKHKSYVLWFTGLSGSGKSTLANALESKLYELGHHTYLLDGDNIRHGLNKDLGFDKDSRVENIRRIGEVAKLFVDSGSIVLTAFISPFITDRQIVRSLVQENEFIEIFVDTPLVVCEQRDPKGLYKKVRDGELKNFTGVDIEYEKPLNPEIYIENSQTSIDENIQIILTYLKQKDLIK